ncbi:MAG: superoxide dismutase family protein [Bryobacteraceae bacterium]|nr:superoxide dismutase family protein [Bryobacteraceae bacterium]
MRYTFVLAAAALFVAGSLIPAEAQMRTAKTQLKNAEGKVLGNVTLREAAGGGVLIEADLSGLTAGQHAFHIHEVGACDPPDFTTAKGHFNPGGKKHGFLNPDGFHAGDMPNFEVPDSGKLKLTVFNHAVTLEKGAKNSLFHSGGTSLMIHHHADDYKTDPAGDAGGRIACGVITQ